MLDKLEDPSKSVSKNIYVTLNTETRNPNSINTL